MPVIDEACDRCGHRAYVEVIFTATGRALYFCAHHARTCRVESLPNVIIINATEQLQEG